ncbi:anoctamin-8 isoform X8 [Drosophila guanche]|uniref:Anoctamin n=1 Tax=Drosophila guanche TaxID=7266 RepID=A0A3B0K7H6_DROGU|nr:anoctamin-8 isoform X8 [Drosophila guanche]SPP90034.1 blast:Anoctamin-8 [Drosophila guanche]
MSQSFDSSHGSGSVGPRLGYPERQSSEDVPESTATATTETGTATTTAGDGQQGAGVGAGGEDNITDDNFESNLRRRKGKIISCAKETIENASRHIRRKVPYAGHLMTPRRLWLNKIPTQCDVVIEFPEDSPDEALRWLLARIRSQPPAGLGLLVQVKAHESTRRNAFYVSAPVNVLFKAAEEARLPKRLRPDLGSALREFTTRESHCFQQLRGDVASTALFTSQERQWLVLQVLQGLRAGCSDIDALHGRAAVAEGQSIVAAWQESGLITQVFPLHEPRSLTQLQTHWVKQIFAPQPLDDIAAYFGVKVALYFAWLGHYTCALGVPAIFGTILYCILWGKGQTAQDMGHVLFSLFNVAWASLYLEAWKRYSVELAFRWGTLSTPPELLEPPRPLYKGPLEENNVTGRLEPKESPAWQRRAFRYLVSFPIIGCCLCMVFAVMFLMLRFQDWWDSKLPEDSVLCCLSVIPKVLLAGAITLMDEAYFKLAVWLNDKENYRLQSKYENHLIAKVALFQFVNSFLSLFYIAFYLRDEEKLKEQLAGLLISRQIIGNLRESALPYFVEQYKLAKLSFNMWGALSPTQNLTRSLAEELATAEAELKAEASGTPTKTHQQSQEASKRNIGQAEIESSLYKYNGTFSDHLEMLVQMGYVVLFSAAFPLAGMCALINNLMEIRSDAFKLAHVHQRPFGQRVANIGTWQNALSILSLAAVIVNCALIGLSGQVSRLWPGLTTAQTIILIVTLEHIMLGLRQALTWLLPELPSWLAAEIARAEHCRREMQCKGTSPRPTPPTPQSTTSTQPEQEGSRGMLQPESGANTTHDQCMESQVAEDMLLYGHEFATSGYGRNIEADVNIYENRDSSPDSPPSQTSTILIRPLHESTPPHGGASLSSLHYDGNGGASASTLALNSAAFAARMQPIHLPEIPPFRKKSSDSADHTGSSNSSSPQRATMRQLSAQYQPQQQLQQEHQQRISEIPPFKTRKISAESATHLTLSELANSDNTSDILKPAPSWSNVALKTGTPGSLLATPPASQQQHHIVASSSSSSGGGGSVFSTSGLGPNGASGRISNSQSRPSVGALSNSSSSSSHKQQKKLEKEEKEREKKEEKERGRERKEEKEKERKEEKEKEKQREKEREKEKERDKEKEKEESAAASTSAGALDDEAKAAELAAKKSRLKQKLVKSARSVAIFSLKLKERRQREAEKAATIAVEHAKALAKLPIHQAVGGELSLIPIEQLIQIEDLQPAIKPLTANVSTTTAPTSTSSLAGTSMQHQHHHQYQQQQYHPPHPHTDD